MEYIYTQNPAAKKPIILIDKYIGIDAKGIKGIDGGQFAREILALKNSGKTEAEVWINSKGGQWSEGVNMVGAMRNSGIDFTTVNMGLVDSTAGHIFQQGKKRIWNDYGLGLVHDMQGTGSESIMEAMNNSVATMLSEKSKMSIEEVRAIMAIGTILNADKAKEYGLCDEIGYCNDVLSFTNSSDVIEIVAFGQNQIKKLLPKNKNMEALNQVLGLTNEASENAQLAAVNKIIEARNAAETALVTKNTELTKTSAELTEAKGKLLVAENAVLAATNASKQTAAEALVAEHKGKRIVDTPESIAKWTNAAIADYDGTKALIEGINLNTKAPAPPVNGGQRSANAPIISVGEYMTRK